MKNFYSAQANFAKFDNTRRCEGGVLVAIFHVYANGHLAYKDELSQDMVAEEIEALSAQLKDASYTDLQKRIEHQLREYNKGLQRIKAFQTDILIPKDAGAPKIRMA